jgi:hypothetical protein
MIKAKQTFPEVEEEQKRGLEEIEGLCSKGPRMITF